MFVGMAARHQEGGPDLAAQLTECRRAAWQCDAYLVFRDRLIPSGVSQSVVLWQESGDDYVVDLDRDGNPVGIEFLAPLPAASASSGPSPLSKFDPRLLRLAHDTAVLGLEAAVAGDPRFGHLDAGTFVGLLLEGMLNGFYTELEGIERGLDEIDERALGREPSDALLGDLVSARHRIAVLRRTLAPQREVYAALARPTDDENQPIGAPLPELTSRLERTLMRSTAPAIPCSAHSTSS